MENRRLHGCLGLVVAVLLAMLTTMVLGRALNACDAGVNNAANSTFLLYFFIPALSAVLLMAWVLLGALLGGRPFLHAVVLGAALLALCWCALAFFWSGVTPNCPGGTPGWWPHLLPAPAFP
ncbi:hypothetical protein AB0912_26555 [Streptomyces sp. NPDC007084]|uniref:hypothetical protein n=1 Tax=Streptomyces sp. NPDC007084 TaxID=3154313 RepID=UPI0034546567